MGKPFPNPLLAVIAGLAAVALVVFGGVAIKESLPNPNFEPRIGQPGKDVIWEPTPETLVAEMLKAAKVGPRDVLVDLGSGDGRIPIAAARDFGARARGVEFNGDMVALARRRAAAAGVADKAAFVKGDIFKADVSDASVVTLYLLPRLNMRLRPALLALKPGARIVSHKFDLEDWRPDAQIQAEGSTAYIWIVPAKAAGEWSVPLTTGEAVQVHLDQKYQEVSGWAVVAGKSMPLVNPHLQGAHLTFGFADWRGGAWAVQAEIDGDAMTGAVTRQGGDIERSFQAKRR